MVEMRQIQKLWKISNPKSRKTLLKYRKVTQSGMKRSQLLWREKNKKEEKEIWVELSREREKKKSALNTSLLRSKQKT